MRNFIYQNERLLAWVLVVFLIVAPLLGISASQGETEQAGSGSGKMTLPDYVDAITQHVLQPGDQPLGYTATAGTLPLLNEAGVLQARMFYVGYVMQGADTTQRPITFVLNGGPGAAAVYLHLGALGPKRLVFNADGTLPPAPVRLTENPFTWLTFTDLVFIDPIGTGYSHSVRQDENKDPAKTFWGIEHDLQSLEAFIRLYLTRYSRWLSPKFLVGESYGGFRVAALAERLPAEARVALNGIILVSPALEFSFLAEDTYRLLPWVLRLPSYAAVAQFHRKAALPHPPEADFAAARGAIERFSLTEVLPGLAQGEGSEESQAQELYTSIARTIGLPSAFVRRHRGKVPLRSFVKALLHDTQRLVSLYDGTVTVIDPDPAHPTHVGQDSLLESLTAGFTAAFSSYVREELHFAIDAPYHALNPQVSKAWDWRSGLDAAQGFVGIASTLKSALSQSPGLQALIVHGYYDLVTPYFGSTFVVRQMGLDAALRSHLVLQVYEGGHMFYTRTAALEQFTRDAHAFFQSARPPVSESPAGGASPGGR